jgi:two-component system OmpR family response regulator
MKQAVNPGAARIPKIFVICDQDDTAAVWGYILRHQGLTVILETSPEKAQARWTNENPDLVVIDIAARKKDPVELCRRFRDVSTAGLLLLLPLHNETQILEAYAAGVDEVAVKPISPAIFLAKIQAWVRHTWSVDTEDLHIVKAGMHKLDLSHRCMIDPKGVEKKLTNLEFRLLLLLMSRPNRVFKTDEIVQAVWGEFGEGDWVLLKNLVYRLRRKIEADPSSPLILQTEPGGYSFQG